MINLDSTQTNKNISFKQIPFQKLNGIKAFSEIHCITPAKTLEHIPSKDYFLRIERDYVPEKFHLELDNDDFENIGSSEIELKNNKTLYNHNIDVIKKSLRHSGTGSIMHLGHIITMLENGMDKIELYSLGEAVHFHSKFKFEPAIKDIQSLSDFLQLDILPKADDKRFNRLAKKVINWNSNRDTSLQDKLKKGNQILYEYLQIINQQKLNRLRKYQISPGFNMVLTREKVIENKDFYNNLFKKYGIDYEISS